MVSSVLNKKIAIVGAGKFCERFLTFFFKTNVRGEKPVIMGVADKNRLARGIVLAEELDIPTTTDFREFAKMEGLDVIIEMSDHPALADAISRQMPESVQVIDHYDARTLWDMLNIQIFRDRCFPEDTTDDRQPAAAQNLLDDLMDRFAAILDERTSRTRQVVQNLWEQKQIIAQIVEGSTAPTFVIDKNHHVTHWNKALEKLTQVPAENVVGTNRQWFPFYDKPRPSLADIVLDQLDTSELGKYYYTGWDKSALIEGAYQAESFFEKLGAAGKWLFMNAAPIKAGDGEVIGAIETFWDITKNKIAAHEQERHNRELSTLVEIYTALNAPGDFEKRLDNALSVVRDFIGAVNMCIFLKDENNDFSLRYMSGTCNYPGFQKDRTAMAEMVQKMEDTGQLSIYGTSRSPEMACPFARDGNIQSLIYLPVNDKENNFLGVIYITSRHPEQTVEQEKDILELIGNRIGVAVENALLQEQYIKSEEKYRTLFNNDPTPIFILEKQDCRIIDMNQRARNTYGYKLEELSGTPFTALGDPDDDEVISGLANVTMERSVLFSKKRHYRKGGDPFFVTIVVSAAEYGGSEILIVNTTDISEIVKKEAQLVQAAKMSTLGVMAAGMAHEINQPLNAIQICADYFMKINKKGETVSPDDLKTMTTNIIENVDRASKVIRRVRDFARQTDVTRHKININAPIRDSVKVLNHEIKKHEINLSLHLERYMPPIMADHNRLEQVFINLISNAIDAIEEKAQQHPDSPPGSFIDKTIAITTGFAGGDVSVTVSDMGAGMSEQVQEKIFEPFFTTKETGKGTGLGVSISYGIIRDYEGEVAVKSRVGEGTSITITFPAAGPPSEKS
ncbi:MAG: PAS domain S-box protein [Thermodesulfobacteriota bacterium]|nr:PAS domain S-box protein [Thermodesulfobacteriota bacterium]